MRGNLIRNRESLSGHATLGKCPSTLLISLRSWGSLDILMVAPRCTPSSRAPRELGKNTDSQAHLQIFWAKKSSQVMHRNLYFLTNFLADSSGKAGLGTAGLDHLQALCLSQHSVLLCKRFWFPTSTKGVGSWKQMVDGILLSPSHTNYGPILWPAHFPARLQMFWSITGQSGSWVGLVGDGLVPGGRLLLAHSTGLVWGLGKGVRGWARCWKEGSGLWWHIDCWTEFRSQLCNVLVTWPWTA